MATLHRVTENWWRWLLHCWRLRLEVRRLAEDFSKSPTHVEVANLQNELRLVRSHLESTKQDLGQSCADLAIARREHEEKYASLKAKYDKRIHATESDQVEAVKTELRAERDAKHLLELEVRSLEDRLAEQTEQFNLARDGNQALLKFIHTRHRLNVKFDPESIRGALQRMDLKGVNGR